MKQEERENLLRGIRFEDFLKRLEDCPDNILMCYPDGLVVHCSPESDKEKIARTLKSMFEKETREIIDFTQKEVRKGNVLEGDLGIGCTIKGNDIYYDFYGASFTEYGSDVDLHDDLFDLGDGILKTLEKVCAKDGLYPELTYEGLFVCYQYWGETYRSYTLLCNMPDNNYGKQLFLQDEELWENFDDEIEEIFMEQEKSDPIIVLPEQKQLFLKQKHLRHRRLERKGRQRRR